MSLTVLTEYLGRTVLKVSRLTQPLDIELTAIDGRQ